MNIQAEEFWSNATAEQRAHVLMNCGWRNHDGRPSPIARRADKRTWDDLSPAMQNILTDRVRRGDCGI